VSTVAVATTMGLLHIPCGYQFAAALETLGPSERANSVLISRQTCSVGIRAALPALNPVVSPLGFTSAPTQAGVHEVGSSGLLHKSRGI
jgi:hypothetical protein